MSPKLFSTEFFSCLISSETSNRFSLSDYFENAYSREYDFCDALPCELCHKSVSVTSPFSYEAANLNALCIIHTTNGVGRLYYENANGINAGYDLTKGTLAVIDCRKNHKLVCQHNIWEYTICFVSTLILEYYLQKIFSLGNFIYRLDKYSDVLAAWEQVLRNTIDTELHGIMRSRELVNFFTQLYLVRAIEQTGSYHIPSYIVHMHQRFTTAYHEPYSLDELALEYGINKFRLCREFAKYYEYTPIQYLNKIRIEKAKELLLATDEKIVDIGQMVGIENTNHFIRLFKEKTGVTPLTYRRETPVIN
ncbi:MAG: helix-turn-helix transcriptional regulator [Lachnospiraceae bacterium]|nr:helix-turn-helix transcriptional regulator [Lachnospiraceae bacterium]MDE7203006.1 helix-turn-helix transcriptional regulator [Lachnospiraceae bacterium]